MKKWNQTIVTWSPRTPQGLFAFISWPRVRLARLEVATKAYPSSSATLRLEIGDLNPDPEVTLALRKKVLRALHEQGLKGYYSVQRYAHFYHFDLKSGKEFVRTAFDVGFAVLAELKVAETGHESLKKPAMRVETWVRDDASQDPSERGQWRPLSHILGERAFQAAKLAG